VLLRCLKVFACGAFQRLVERRGVFCCSEPGRSDASPACPSMRTTGRPSSSSPPLRALCGPPARSTRRRCRLHSLVEEVALVLTRFGSAAHADTKSLSAHREAPSAWARRGWRRSQSAHAPARAPSSIAYQRRYRQARMRCWYFARIFLSMLEMWVPPLSFVSYSRSAWVLWVVAAWGSPAGPSLGGCHVDQNRMCWSPCPVLSPVSSPRRAGHHTRSNPASGGRRRRRGRRRHAQIGGE